jgi:hypothetical protein
MGSNTPTSTQKGVTLQIELLPCVNLAMVDNQVLIGNRCALVNATDNEMEAITVVVSGEHVQDNSMTINRLPSNWTVQLSGLKLEFDRQFLAQLDVPVKTRVSFMAHCNGELVCERESEVCLLPDNYWAGLDVLPAAVAAHVLPHSLAVKELLDKASPILDQITGEAQFDDYQTQDPNRARAQLAAIYRAIQLNEFTLEPLKNELNCYRSPVRTPEQIVEARTANCLEWALMVASCIEACGLNSLLVFLKDRVMVGMWLVDSYNSHTVSDDKAFLLKAANDSVAEMELLDVVACARQDKEITFNEATQRADALLREAEQDFNCFIDIKACRLQNIKPSRLTMAAEAPESSKDVTQVMTDGIPELQPKIPVEIDTTQQAEVTKQQIWERKLLDFSMRNNLLNMRIGKRVLPFISFAINELEDHVNNGEDYDILPSPSEQRLMPDENGIYDSARFRDEWQELVVNDLKQHRLRTYLNETEMVNVLKFIHRTSRIAIEENGANSLFLALGILKWYETDRSIKPRYAPILMIPVDLIRHGANRYVIRSRDEDTIINVTLVEMVKQQFQLSIPGVEPLPTDHSGVDVLQVLASIRSAIMNRPRWDVLDEAVLGLFSFSKFVMWNDIHHHANILAKHPVIQALASNQALRLTHEGEEDIDARVLDEETSPADFAIPVDVDSSQFEAIVESGRGHSFVLHGPPGTGKSQTITNMIANALFQGKRVLFVAEKMAALEVVQKRLKAIGIDPFCLELHSNKATKSHVLQQLSNALNTIDRFTLREFMDIAQKLGKEREVLAQYVRELHAKQPSGLSLYQCLSLYLAMEGDELASEKMDHKLLTVDVIEHIEQLIRSTSTVTQLTGVPANNPLYGLVIDKSDPDNLARVITLLNQLEQNMVQLNVDADQINQLMGVDLGRKPSSFQALSQLCHWLGDIKYLTPGMIDTAASQHDQWQAMLDMGDDRKLKKQVMQSMFLPSAFSLNATELLAKWNNINQQWWLIKQFKRWQFTKKLKPYLVVQQGPDIDQLLQVLLDFQQADARCDANWQNRLNTCLGYNIDKDNADWQQLKGLYADAERLLKRIAEGFKPRQRDMIITQLKQVTAFNPRIIAEHAALWSKTAKDYSALQQTQVRMSGCCAFEDPDNEHIGELASAMAPSVKNKGRDWKLWTDRAAELRPYKVDEVLTALAVGEDADQVANAWKKGVYHKIITDVLAENELLASFSGPVFEDTIKRFKQLDHQFQVLTKKQLYNQLARRLREYSANPSVYPLIGYLRRNIANRGRGQSVRNIMDHLSPILPNLCPCMLMSPISVAQYLDLNQPPFDMVIFDEASQMPTSEAVGAIARGRSLIVVGDPKQMPPTNFFNVNQVDESEAVIDDLDSVLDDAIALDFPSRHLRWHYRSRHESLIAFSNSQYYDGRLITFPSVDDRNTKVTFIPVQGVYDYGRSRSNSAEAQAIVAEVMRRLGDKELRKFSMGIVAFSISQQNMIEDLLLDAFAANPELEAYATDCEEPLFIKNLENVQGDERDVIMFSIGYGPDARGKVSMNFGPLNNSGGERRLNVAVSRARYEMMVFSTLQPEQIDLNRSKSLGVQGLKQFLEFARDGRTSYQISTQQPEVNVMAEQLAQVLTDKGYQVTMTVGRSKFKIDLAVIDPDDPSKYLLGILCDGKGYSDTKTVRDREVCQPAVLSALGWNLVRIWIVDWYFNRDRVVQQVVETLQQIEQRKERTTKDEQEIVLSPSEEPCQEDESSQDSSAHIVTEQPVKMASDSEPNEKPNDLPPVEAEEEEEDEEEDEPEVCTSVNPGKVPYTMAQIAPIEKGGITTLVTSPTLTLSQMKKILAAEQPITFHYACTRMCRIWSVRKINDRVKRYVTWLLKQTAAQDPSGTREVPYYWSELNAREGYCNYRIKSGRGWEDIPLVEIKNSIIEQLEQRGEMSEDALIQMITQLFGIDKCVISFREQVAQAIQSLAQSKVVFTGDSNCRLNMKKRNRYNC